MIWATKKIRTPFGIRIYRVQRLLRCFCLITQQLESQPQQLEQPQQPSLSYDELSS